MVLRDKVKHEVILCLSGDLEIQKQIEVDKKK